MSSHEQLGPKSRSSPCILLVDGGIDPEDSLSQADRGYRAVVSLFWQTLATRRAIEERARAPHFSLHDLIGSEYEWGRQAYALAERYLASSPRHGDQPWRRYLMEPIYHELLPLHLMIRLAELSERQRQTWRLDELTLEGWLRGGMRELLEAVLESFPSLSYRALERVGAEPMADSPSRLERGLRRFCEARATGAWTTLAGELAEALDPTFRYRTRWGRHLFRRRPPKHGTVCLSSYANNTHSLLSLRDQLPEPVHWVLVNFSARRALDPDSESAFWLWAFGSVGQSELVDPGDGARDDDPPGYGFWRRTSPAVKRWLRVEQVLLRMLTACWERYLDEAEPRLVVVANQLGLEGWLAGIARARGIPIVQVMHGLLGGYFYTGTPVLSDLLVVYGEQWRRLWPEAERSKILAYNPGRIVAVPRRPSSRRRLTFFSWPLETKPFYNGPEFHRQTLDVFHRLLQRGDIAVTVRFHPLENPHDFRVRWQARHGELPADLRLSKTEPLAEIVAETDVALMFRSTVMLDCLVSGVPVVLPGWIDFVWNEELEDIAVLHLATDFEDLEARIETWLEGPPEIDSERLAAMLRSPGEGRGELETRLARALRASR